MVDVWLVLSIDSICQCDTIFPRTFGYRLNSISRWVEYLPDDCIICPELDQYNKKKYQDGTGIYQKVFIEIVIDNE
jgi:hypothetical protein